MIHEYPSFSAERDIVGCTVISKNYLSHARILARSFKEHHPGAPFYVLLCDENNGDIDATKEPFEMIEVQTIGIPTFREMAFRYNVIELDTAVKPFFFQHLFATRTIQKLVFFDPDILICTPLTELAALMDDHAVILTPHMTTPVDDGNTPSEQTILQAGINNLGFIAMRKSPTVDALLTWWADRLEKYCYIRFDQGLFVDQKWMDLASSYFGDIYQLRKPGYNVAFWNLHERTIGGVQGNWTVNGEPLRFFHFSGYNPLLPHKVSRHQTRIHFENRPDIVPLFTHYQNLQLEAGYKDTHIFRYAFDWFSNGIHITDKDRAQFDSDRLTKKIHDPFQKNEIDSITPSPKNFLFYCKRFLNKRHAWQPYQILTRFIKFLIGKNFFYALKRTFIDKNHPQIHMNAGRAVIHKKGVNLIGLLSRELGIGEAARGHAKALMAAHIPCSLHDVQIGSSRGLDATFADSYSTDARFDISLIEVGADSLFSFMERYKDHLLKNSMYRIGHWAWELPEFPHASWNCFPLLHEIWVASSFVQQSIAASSPIPVITIPYVVRDILKGPHDRKHFGIAEHAFVFLFMFDFFSIFERKNPLATIEAFRKAFPGQENVSLVLKFSNAERYPKEAAILRRAAKCDSRITLIDSYVSVQEVNDLIHSCDCYVSLHRSEGFGLTMAEAMRAEKPVIATNYSGNTDFMNEMNSFLVRYTETEVGAGLNPYPATMTWAEPDIDHAAEQMKLVYTHPDRAKEKAKRGKEDIERDYSSKTIGERIRARLEVLEEIYAA